MTRWPCQHAGCDFATTGVCARAAEFARPETECEDYLRSRPESATAAAPAESFPPWTGDAVGGEHLTREAFATPFRRVLVAGRHNSGKTTLLTSQFIELDRGRHDPLPGRFAGSYTLRGYERLTEAAFGWKPGQGPLVPHTGRGGARDPAWLHLAFRIGRRTRHLYLSDLPGEAFERWAADPDHLDTAGVNDAWLVLDPRDGEAAKSRKHAQNLLRRLILLNVPLSVVFTKRDEARASEEFLSTLRELAPEAAIHHVAAFPGLDATRPAEGVLGPLVPLLAVVAPPRPERPRPTSTRLVDWFGYAP